MGDEATIKEIISEVDTDNVSIYFFLYDDDDDRRGIYVFFTNKGDYWFASVSCYVVSYEA